jgi:hypothetical protein
VRASASTSAPGRRGEDEDGLGMVVWLVADGVLKPGGNGNDRPGPATVRVTAPSLI